MQYFFLLNLQKNNAMGTGDLVFLGDDFYCFRIKNNSDNVEVIEKDLPTDFIQFHFILKGNGVFKFNNGSYTMPIEEENGLILYSPQVGLPLFLEISPETWMVSVLISIKTFHSMFSEEAGFIPFLNKNNIDKKHYSQNKLTPAMSVVLHQILNFNLHSSVKNLYYRAKALELFSLLFNRDEEDLDAEGCPFKSDGEETMKIKKAKEILLSNLTEPPSLQELANEVGLNIKKLKEGFKQIYGDTVYGVLIDHKMDYARKLLDSGRYNVNEVGIKIGYSTASHFIAAFKNKFGITPKKYLLSDKK